MEKVCLVTGSQRGIGKATIIEFASKGYNVVIDYYEEEKKALELKSYIEKEYNIKVLLVKADIRNEEEIKLMVESIINEFGRIDVLVNNAGIALDKEFEDRTVEDWHNTLDTNFNRTFFS